MTKKKEAKAEFGANDFRAELVKIMPGYDWTVHKSRTAGYLEATGTQSSGFNRLSTLSVVRTDRDGKIVYTSKSAGFGLRAKWLHTNFDGTLARSLRGLQEHYEHMSALYRGHASSLRVGRKETVEPFMSAIAVLKQAESFIAGFEDDELQEGIPEMLATIRATIARG